MLSRMVQHASRARAGLLAVGVRAVFDEDLAIGDESTPFSSLKGRLSQKVHAYHSHLRQQQYVDKNHDTATDVLSPAGPPLSLAVLHDTDTDVDPDLLLRDRRIVEIKSGPLMSSAAKKELEECEEEIQRFKQEESLVPVDRSRRLCDKLDILYGRHVIEVTLALSPAGFKAFTDSGFKRLDKRLDTLRRRRDAIEAALEEENYKKALDLSRRALLACHRFEQHLVRVLRELKYKERFHGHRAQTALGAVAAGSLVLLGATFDFFGYLPPSLVSSRAMETITKLVASGTLFCLTYAGYSYLHSMEAKDYLARLRRISLDVESFKHDFEDMRDDADINITWAD
eukprot:m.171401 g.171401  ORF g.171401 m.171401 type:complete len:342 (+) comp16500_c0_seq16:4836-5861(+)